MRVKGTCIRVTSLATLTISSFFSLSISLVLGIFLLKDFDEYDELSSGGDYAEVVAWLLIANSVVSLINILIGFFGLRLSSICLLMLYLFIGAVIVTLEVGSSSFYFVSSRNDYDLLGGHIRDELYTAVVNYQAGNDGSGLVDQLQLKEECCGIDGYKDWRMYNTSWNRTAPVNQYTPKSCCKIQYINNESCNTVTTNTTMINRGGCFEELLDRHQNLATIALALCVFCAVLEVLSRLLVCKTLYILWDFKRQGYNVV